jgi:hypothetical protein
MVGRLTNEQLGEWMLWQQVFDHPQGKSTVEEIAAIVAREAAKLPADDGELLGQAMLRDPRARELAARFAAMMGGCEHVYADDRQGSTMTPSVM